MQGLHTTLYKRNRVLENKNKDLNVSFSIPKVQGLFRCCYKNLTKNDDVNDMDLIVERD